MSNKQCFLAILVSLFLVSGCTEEPKWKTMYNDCIDNVKTNVSEAKNDKNTQAMGEMAESMGMAACDMIKKTCEGNEEGFTCKALVGEETK